MSGAEKILEKILRGTSDANIRFADLRGLLLRLGFGERDTQAGHSPAHFLSLMHFSICVLTYPCQRLESVSGHDPSLVLVAIRARICL